MKPTPKASFTASALSGVAPLTEQFTDTTPGSVTSRKWLFGDGATSTAKAPLHTYGSPGVYVVTLIASNSSGGTSTTKTITVLAAPPEPEPPPPPPAPTPSPAPAPEPAPAPAPAPAPDAVSPMIRRVTVGRYKEYPSTSSYALGRWNTIMAEAIAGDVFEIAPGAVHSQYSDLNNYHSNNLNSALLSITKPGITLRNMAGQARWGLYPDRTQVLGNRNGICIYLPGASDDMTARGAFSCEGFEFDNWGNDAAVRIMPAREIVGSYATMHALLTLKNFKVGRRSGEPSASGISGAVETLLVEDGHVYDCGNGSGQEHNAYISARTMTWRRVRQERTRGWPGTPYVGFAGIEGHIFKVSAVTGLIEDCIIECAPLADQSLLLQMKAGGNWTVRGNLFVDSQAPNNANGAILMEREYGGGGAPNFEWWAGAEGNSLLFEKNTYIGHYPRPIVFFRDPATYPNQALYAAGDASVAPARRLSSFVCRDNIAMVTNTQPYGSWMLPGFPGASNDMWLMRDPNGGANWAARGNTSLPYDQEIGRQMATAVSDSYSAPSGGTIDTTVPTWRRNMPEDTIVEVGGLPSAAEIDWPAAGANNFLMVGGADNNPKLLHYGYGGKVFVPEMGRHGTLVCGTTGEACITNQLTKFPFSDNDPQWAFLQQPDFATSLAEAITMDADAYYNEADYAASSQKLDVVGEEAWNGTFPVGYRNWVIRRKASTSFTGNNRPHWFRYGMPRSIPASMTGTGAPAIIVNSRSWQGPFAQGPKPLGATDAQWFADVWGTGRRKHFLHAMNPLTGEWQRLTTPVPDFTGYTGDISSPLAFVDEVNKRIYYHTYNGTDHALYYADFGAGLAGMTFVGPTNLSDLAGGPGLSQASNSVLCVPASGANAGRRFWYAREQNATPSLLMVDVDNNTLRRLSITGLPSGTDQWGMCYDDVRNRFFITVRTSSGVTYYKFAIPTDPTNAANYSITSTVLSGAATEELDGIWQYGDSNKFLKSLGLIPIPQKNNRMVVFRPSA